MDLQRIDGKHISLRLITSGDADYIHKLRTDSKYNTHLSTVTGTSKDQASWIERYKEREAAGLEYYYIIERRVDKLQCGAVRLYDITEQQFTWGSWILDENKPRKAALESAVLSFGVGFCQLDLTVANVEVRAQNLHAQAFYRRFGMVQTHEENNNIHYIYRRETFIADRAAHMACIDKAL